VYEYSALNPHLTIAADWDGARDELESTAPDWPKWRPSDPVPAHWYDVTRFEQCIAARIRRDQNLGTDRPLREFLAEFRGLSSTAKQKTILEEIGAARQPLSQVFSDRAGDVRHADLAKLLHAMQRESRPVKAHDLGVIGPAHLLARCLSLGADPASFKYEKFIGESGDNLFVVEAAFAVRPGAVGRGILAGVNFSPAIGDPFRLLGRHHSLDDVLTQRSCDSRAPIVLLVHYTSPHVAFADRGKATLVLPTAQADAIVETVGKVTARWRKNHRATELAEQRDSARLIKEYERLQQDRERDGARYAADLRRAKRDKERELTAGVVGTGVLHRVILEAAEAEGSCCSARRVASAPSRAGVRPASARR
jgi:hypothetical protein